MVKILKPYVKNYIEVHDLPEDQKVILYIDCYPVHIGEEFRGYVFEEFPNVFLIYVPANCEFTNQIVLVPSSKTRHDTGTGIFQPADVGLQRVIKQYIRQEVLQFLVANHFQQRKAGLGAEQVKVTTSLPVLRDASVQPIVSLYKFFQDYKGREIIKNVRRVF
jgi:hypothetical protein